MQIIDQAKMEDPKTQILDIGKPPMKTVPDEFWPKLVYKYPKTPFRKAMVPVGGGRSEEQTIANEHTYKKVADKKELEAALKAGWQEKPYLPKDPDADIVPE